MADIVSCNLNHHFLIFLLTMRILFDTNLCANSAMINHANDLLNIFVKQWGKLYEKESLVYNVNCLIHIAQDVHNNSNHSETFQLFHRRTTWVK